MPFTLKLTISGLCLFVPDNATNCMHVLMPSTDREFTACNSKAMYVPSHAAWLLYDRKYEAGAGSSMGTAVVPLDGVAQCLGNGGVDTLHVPCEVADLHDAAGATVPSEFATVSIAPPLAARLTLSSGYASSVVTGGYRWNFGSHQNHILTTGVEWTMGYVASSSLALDTAHGPRILKPSGGAIELKIYCVPPHHLLDKDDSNDSHEPGDMPPHFTAFYSLCTSNGVQCPTYVSDNSAASIGEKDLHSSGVVPFTCLAGTAPMG